ncbi:hypothetical protein MTO96_023072 [Rhipicephalus appendiculatus]
MMTFPNVETTNEVFLASPEMEFSLLESTGSMVQDTSEETSWGSPGWFAIALCLLGVLPGILAGAALTIHFLSTEPEFTTTLEEGLGSGSSGLSEGGLVAPTIPPSLTVKSETTTRKTIATSPSPPTEPSAPLSTTPLPGTVSTPAGANDSVCTTERCHFLAQWLRQKLHPNVDPCHDFYHYVCGTYDWWRTNVLIETRLSMSSIMIGAAYAARVPATGQSSWQKAAGIFQACVALAESGNSETKDLVKWMVSIHLDLGNLAALKAVDPMDMMIAYSKADAYSQAVLRNTTKNESFPIYVALLKLYGLDPSGTDSLATSISELEAQLDSIVLNKTTTNATSTLGPIRGMGQRTTPYITEAQWASAFAKHTNNTYRGDDKIMYTEALLDILVGLFQSVDAGGINSLIAWSVFRQMVGHTEPRFLFADNAPTTACFFVVDRVMKLAFASRYLNFDTVPDVDTNRFFKAYRAALQASAHRSWSDQKTWIYDETDVNAYYVRELNTVVIPAGILQNPFFNVEGPAALNYGGIGVIIGHEIMHGYDVGGTMYDDASMKREWTTPEFLKKYTERTLCLRKSHKAALERNVRLPDLNLTSEHLFFIGNCAKWCEGQNVNSARYAAGHFRCNVPLMNMAEFSAAFACAPQTPMNPSNKCAFWS